MLKLLSVPSVNLTRGGEKARAPPKSHVDFSPVILGGKSFYQFVKQIGETGGKEVSVLERRFHESYCGQPIKVKPEDLSPIPKLKIGDVVLYKGVLPANTHRFLVIEKVKVIKRNSFVNPNQIQRFEYETVNLHDGAAGMGGKFVSEAEVMRCFSEGDVFVRVDGLEVLHGVVTRVNKACPLLVECAQVKLTPSNEGTAQVPAVTVSEVETCVQYLNSSVLESGFHMVRNSHDNYVNCVYLIFYESRKGNLAFCLRWANSEQKETKLRLLNYRRMLRAPVHHI